MAVSSPHYLHIADLQTKISSDHSALTRTLTENAMSLTASLNNFHTDFAKFVSHRATSGQRELCDLAHKFGDLEDTVKQYVHCLRVAFKPLTEPTVIQTLFFRQ